MILWAVTGLRAADAVPITPPILPIINAQPASDWTGFFAGGIIGYGGGDFTNNLPANPGPTGGTSGFTGGVQVGYIHQVHSNWAVGVDVDFSFLDIETSSAIGSFKEDWMITARGRGGYTFSRYFAYLTAGVAFTHKDATLNGVGSGDDVVAGVTAGAGVQARLGRKWSARSEYLYVKVPDDGISIGGTSFVGGSDNHFSRFSLNYHF